MENISTHSLLLVIDIISKWIIPYFLGRSWSKFFINNVNREKWKNNSNTFYDGGNTFNHTYTQTKTSCRQIWVLINDKN